MKPRPTHILVLLVAACLWSCAGSTTTRQTETIDEEGQPGTSTKTDTRIFANKDEAALDKARGDRRLGHYPEAAAGFQAVYDNISAKPELREQALFELARVNADLLNPRKDPDKAAGLFEKFLAEYPKSPLAKEATEQLAALRAVRR